MLVQRFHIFTSKNIIFLKWVAAKSSKKIASGDNFLENPLHNFGMLHKLVQIFGPAIPSAMQNMVTCVTALTDWMAIAMTMSSLSVSQSHI